jgi:NodT family efflux transporter outer membrane factor (OMF) lipoprotein
LVLCLCLGACNTAPTLKAPDVPTAAAYKEALDWARAQPADTLARGPWWTFYGDPQLNALEDQLLANSPDLSAALARYQQARASTDQVRAGQYPTLTASGNLQRDQQSQARPLRVLGPTSPDQYDSYTVGVDLEYEFDLWGRVSNQVAASNYALQGAQTDLESARLSLQAQLADTYIALRGLDRDAALLTQTVDNYKKALDLTNTRHNAGIASGLDVARAQTQLESSRSQLQQSSAQRAVLEHAIAALVGNSASSFSLTPQAIELALPEVPPGVPSTLLQRRPDIAGAQRRMVSANASLGVANAAFFPTVTLSALAGYQTSDIENFLRAPNMYWAIGPSLFLTLFDAGKRQAEIDRVQAVLGENAARYRSLVLSAFQQVEDNLALLGRYRAASESEQAATVAAQKALELATNRYREGSANYLEVVAAQSAALQSERSALELSTRQRRASVQLIKSLGGGWSKNY